MTGIEIALTGLALFIGMLFFTEMGRRVARIRNPAEGPSQSFDVLEGGLFGLMGLLIALTFSTSASRLEARRQVVVDEANAIGTAWLRIAQLPEARQRPIRHLFRQYVETRLAFFRDAGNLQLATNALDRTKALQDEIWSQGVVACAESPSTATAILFLPALNSMIDLTTTSTMLAKNHLPWLIRGLLIFSPLVCAFLGGIESAPRTRREWMPAILFAVLLSLTVYVILDLDYPRVGLIRVDPVDEAMIELGISMGSGE